MWKYLAKSLKGRVSLLVTYLVFISTNNPLLEISQIELTSFVKQLLTVLFHDKKPSFFFFFFARRLFCNKVKSSIRSLLFAMVQAALERVALSIMKNFVVCKEKRLVVGIL